MRARAEPVRNYSLYGEPGQLPDVMHCETVSERSVLHDWELSARRHDRLHQILLLHRGGGTARFDDRALALHPRALVNVPPGAVHGFRFDRDTQGLVVRLADAMIDELLGRDPRRQQARPEPARRRRPGRGRSRASPGDVFVQGRRRLRVHGRGELHAVRARPRAGREAAGYITEGLENCYVMLKDERPISLQLPAQVELDVVDTAPELKGATATKRPKPARLSTGVEIQVPEYITTDERIRVSTETGEFAGRA